MKRNDKKALQEMDILALQKRGEELRKEFAVSKMQFRVGKLKNVRLLSVLRHKLAVVETLLTQKEKVNA